MRITISHNRSKAEIIESVDRSCNEMFQGASALPMRLVVKQRSWQGIGTQFLAYGKVGITEHTGRGDCNGHRPGRYGGR